MVFFVSVPCLYRVYFGLHLHFTLLAFLSQIPGFVGPDPRRVNINWSAIRYPGPDPNACPTLPADDVPAIVSPKLQTALESMYTFIPLEISKGTLSEQKDQRLRRYASRQTGANTSVEKDSCLSFDASSSPSSSSPSLSFSRIDFLREAYTRLVEEEKATGYLKSTHNTTDTLGIEMEADVIIIGSGAGGGVAAQALSTPNLRVLILEKGSYVAPGTHTLVEEDAMETMYEGRSFLTTSDASINVLAGSTLGGGTAVNWACSLDPPVSLLEEWATEHSLPHLVSDQFQEYLQFVKERMGVHGGDTVVHNQANQLLLQGGEKMGYTTKIAPQNGLGSHDCGWCCFGCAFGHKQGSNHSFLVDAAQQGAGVVVHCTVEKILHTSIPETFGESLISSGKHACGAVFTVKDAATGELLRCRVFAPLVILSAGSLHSPLVLSRSGLGKNPHVGCNLRMHPSMAIVGVFPPSQPVKCYSGAILTALVETPPHPDDFIGSELQYLYSSKIELSSPHPGLAAASIKWQGCFSSKRNLLSYDHIAPFVGLQRDSGSGSVTEGDYGLPRIIYRASKKDCASLTRALVAGMHMLAKAGAVKVITPLFTINDPEIDPELNTRDPGFIMQVQEVKKHGIRPTHCAMFSAHQMGTCRMNGTKGKGVVKPSGEAWDVDGLFICDASVFPTSSGVNPMLTTLAMSRSTALHAKKYVDELFS